MEELLKKICAVFATNSAMLKNGVIHLRSAKTLITYQVEIKRDFFYIYAAGEIQEILDTQDEVVQWFMIDREIDQIQTQSKSSLL